MRGLSPALTLVAVHLSEEKERELVSLYQTDNSVAVKDIQEMFGLSTSDFYRLLERRGIVRRRPDQARTSVSKRRAISELRREAELVNPTEPPLVPTDTLSVTVDTNGFVSNIERQPPVARKQHVWEVRFESAMRVEAHDIVEAISEVQKLPMCRRVFNVALKGAL